MAQQKPFSATCIGYRARGVCGEAFDLFERSFEPIQNSVELDAHLERQRPACVVIRRNRRAAGIREVVGMVLRLEHVHHVGPERLSRLHNV